MKIAILGAGPAGLFAAHAVASNGWEPQIFSIGGKSRLYGAQYLHRPIPLLSTDEPILIDYLIQGTVEGYRKKVYLGERIVVSPEVLHGLQYGWDIRAAYDKAWRLYSGAITPVNVGVGWVEGAINTFDLIISTIPAPQICKGDSHNFTCQRIWAIGDAPDLGVWCPVEVAESTIICNGMKRPSWYRASNVFGHRTAEWPYSADIGDVPVKAKLVKKPIATNCDCWGDKVLKLGRYGAWSKTELSHSSFYRTMEYLDEREAVVRR